MGIDTINSPLSIIDLLEYAQKVEQSCFVICDDLPAKIKNAEHEKFINSAIGISQVAIKQNWSTEIQVNEDMFAREQALRAIFSFFSVYDKNSRNVVNKGMAIHNSLVELKK